jgi:hypothetical protein
VREKPEKCPKRTEADRWWEVSIEDKKEPQSTKMGVRRSGKAVPSRS